MIHSRLQTPWGPCGPCKGASNPIRLSSLQSGNLFFIFHFPRSTPLAPYRTHPRPTPHPPNRRILQPTGSSTTAVQYAGASRGRRAILSSSYTALPNRLSWTATHQYEIFRGGIGRHGLVCTSPVRGDVAYDVRAGDLGRRARERADTPRLGKRESGGIIRFVCGAKTILAVH